MEEKTLTFYGERQLDTLHRMLRAYAEQCHVTYCLKPTPGPYRAGYVFEFKKGRFVTRSAFVSLSDLEDRNLYYLFEMVKKVVDSLYQEYHYIDTDIKLTTETRDRIVRVMNQMYGTCAAEPDPKESLWLKKKSGPYAWGKGPEIKDVKFADPATIVFWTDGTKTVVRAQNGDTYDPEKGLAMAICKKRDGNKWSYYNTFLHWLKKYKPESGDVETVTHTTKVIKED